MNDTLEVQYGECMYVSPGGKEMPAEIREKLIDRAEAVARALGYPMTRHDLLWVPPKSSPGDPLGQQGTAAIRFFLAQPRSLVEAQRDARILSEGWVREEDFEWPHPRNGQHIELADFSFNGVPHRYARVRKDSAR